MDILQTEKDLKKMPYRVPEGYFASLSKQTGLQCPEKQTVVPASQRTLWQILAPYAAMAAMFAVITLGGKALIGISGQSSGWTETEEFIYTELMPATGPSESIYEPEKSEYLADAEVSDGDIIQYLIYSGTQLDEINFDDYE